MSQDNLNTLFDLKNFFSGESYTEIITTILDQTPDIIYIAEIETRRIIYINARVKDILGLTGEEIYDKGFDFFTDLVHPEDYLKRMDQMSQLARQNSDEVKETELRLEAHGGAYHWFRIREKVFSRNAQGEMEKLIGIATDIQSEKTAEEEARKLNREVFKKNQELKSLNIELESMNRITAGEFGDTLQTMYTCLEYIATKDAEKFSNASKGNLRRAQSYIQKLRLMAHDLAAYLHLSKITEKQTLLDLNKIFHEAIKALPTNRYMYSLQSPKLPWIRGNRLMLVLLFKNLLENAVKFNREEEPSAVRVHYLKADEINFHPIALKDTAYHIISVSDNGIGFGNEQSEKIFRIFYQIHGHKFRGSGIGLAVCKRIMELHGGFIEAESTPGKGSTFTCYFPEEDERTGW
jgi:PAS domain S-box-containing protein